MELRKHERLHSEENLVNYVKFSTGAIELHEDYVVFYRNIFPFTKGVHGRTSTIINFDDIAVVTYKGTGWLRGGYRIRLKNVMLPVHFLITNWFPWTNYKLNFQLREIYKFIFEKVQISWKNDKCRKIQTFEEIKKLGNCPVCNHEIAEGSVFCDKCGVKLGEN